MVLGGAAVEPVDHTSILSGTPAHIIYSIFEQGLDESISRKTEAP
jgi:hypothetical protein